MKVIGVIAARMESSRLPNKVMLELGGTPMIVQIINKMRKCISASILFLCCTNTKPNDVLVGVAKERGIRNFREEPGELIKGIIDLCEQEEADAIVRITGDNPFHCPAVTKRLSDEFVKAGDLDYIRMDGLPIGVTTEIIGIDVYKKLHDLYDDRKKCSDDLTYRIFDNEKSFNMKRLVAPNYLHYPDLCLTVDTMEDYIYARKIYKVVGSSGIRNVIRSIENGRV